MHDGLLEEGLHDWMHFLGTSKLEWALLLTDIQHGGSYCVVDVGWLGMNFLVTAN